MTKLYFENAEFHAGVNLTVRRGVKWSLEKRATLAKLDGTECGDVDFVDTRVFRFCDLKDDDVSMEHDKDCQTCSGLLAVMKQLYPAFDERELVTLVFFAY
jgi:hypothetical protein